MTTRSKLEQIETVYTADLNSGEIPEGSHERRLLIINNERTPSLNPSPVPGLTLTSTNLLGVLHSLNIGKGIEGMRSFSATEVFSMSTIVSLETTRGISAT